MNLTEIEQTTSFVDSYAHFAPGQNVEAYEWACARRARWRRPLDEHCNISIEATYIGWCGDYDERRFQPGNI